MTRRYFGTDGIRGPVGEPPLTPEMIARLGLLAGQWVIQHQGEPKHVVIGRDTRASGVWIEHILTGTLSSLGMEVVRLGVLATPAIASGTQEWEAALGLAITASHNPHTDNGIKLFGRDGFKLADEDQAALDAALAEPAELDGLPERPGRILEDNAHARYWRELARALPGERPLAGLQLVIDCAHGAASAYAPRTLERFGAEVKAIGAAPDGHNINAGCGATQPGALADKVVRTGAYAGIALDGDGDRLIMVDETGAVVDGDQLIALLATYWQAQGRLTGGAVIATVMSNVGLQQHLAGLGVALERTRVGDQYVVEAMRARGCNVGGEQSGHIILTDYGTTGDGLLAALQALAIAKADGRPFSQIARVFEPAPQELVSVPYSGGDPLRQPAVRAAIEAGEARLGTAGRLLVRKSGTEPVIRIMAEALDRSEMEAVLAEVVAAVEAAV